uniref:ABC-type multidrug transport system, ATPase and permease components n=1 Tax=Candidatus Actinomarina minuta TaxID=1389454 RepID=S5DKR3_9ACTN|nr:ABC-type multidrug transport system, ATPase and permease components [Candidatus Actinomarina minuta]
MFNVFKTPEFKKALRFYIEEVKNNRKHFLISMFSAIIWCFLVILHPYLIKRIVDDGIVASNQQVIIVFLSFLIAIGYVRAASIGVRRYFSMSVSFNVEAEIRNTIFGHMQRLAFKYHDKVPTGELMARASSDASQVRLAFAIAPLATANVFLLLLLSVTLVSIDFILGLIVLLSIPLVLYIAGNFASRAMEVSLKVKEAEAEMTTEVEEQLGGIRVVKAFGNEDEASIKVERSIEKIYETSVNFLHLRTRFVPLFELIPMIITLVVLLLGGYLAINEFITLGDFIAFTQYVILLIWPLRITAWFLSEIPSSVSAGNRILELLDEQPSIINNDDLVEFPTDGNGTIEFENVDFSYGNDTIFNELSFKVEGQKTIAIVGATGSGKSTLSYLLPRLYDVKSGTIKIDNVDIKKIKLDDLRNNVSLAFEESFLFSNSAKDNIAIGSIEASQQEVEEAAIIAKAHEFISQLPETYETKVGERGYGLSGGQRQRIALARAIVRNPKILILDDALSAVDASTEEEIRNELQNVMNKMTTLIVTNRVPTIELCDEVLFIEDGKIRAQGKHEDILNEVKSYRSLFLEQEKASKLN